MTTDTTREGFEKWVRSYHFDAMDSDPVLERTPSGVYEDDEIRHKFTGYRAAKADELAFLECLIGFHAPLDRHVAIENRIAELKSVSNG